MAAFENTGPNKLWNYGTMAQWHYGIMTLCHYGTMTPGVPVDTSGYQEYQEDQDQISGATYISDVVLKQRVPALIST